MRYNNGNNWCLKEKGLGSEARGGWVSEFKTSLFGHQSSGTARDTYLS